MTGFDTDRAAGLSAGGPLAADGAGESPMRSGGHIPGAPGVSAFSLRGPAPSAIPILIAAPHAGRAYPAALLDRMRNPGFAALKLEDRYVDRLGEAVAEATGAMLLIAHAPRAMIDLNRSPDDIDWEMFGRPAAELGSYTPTSTSSRRARAGLGLIPRRLPGLGELWKRRHDESELAARVAGIHEPYHACLAATLAELRDRWGAALLLDLHSMPPLAGAAPAEFVLGDRFGATSHGGLVAAAFAVLGGEGRLTAHNRPYAGGYVLERHAAPGKGLHALQLEIDRRSYLDSRLAEPGKGFAAMAELLVVLIRRLAAEVAALGHERIAARFSEAAE